MTISVKKCTSMFLIVFQLKCMFQFIHAIIVVEILID